MENKPKIAGYKPCSICTGSIELPCASSTHMEKQPLKILTALKLISFEVKYGYKKLFIGIASRNAPVDNYSTSFDFVRGLSACRSQFYDTKAHLRTEIASHLRCFLTLLMLVAFTNWCRTRDYGTGELPRVNHFVHTATVCPPCSSIQTLQQLVTVIFISLGPFC